MEWSELNKRGPGTGFSEKRAVKNLPSCRKEGDLLYQPSSYLLLRDDCAPWKYSIVYFVSTLFLLKFRNWFQTHVVIKEEQTCKLDLISTKRIERQPLVNYMMKWTSHSWSQWPYGLRRSSAAARLLRLWVRISPGACMFVCCECCVCCQVEVSAMSWSLVQRSPTDCGASLCVI